MEPATFLKANIAKIPSELEMENSKSRRDADSNDKDREEAKRARTVKMRKALRDWKIEKSRIKGN